jgi:hypothetical protein
MRPKIIKTKKINTFLYVKNLKNFKVVKESKAKDKIINIVPDLEPDKGIEIIIKRVDKNNKKLEIFLVNDLPYLR